MSSAWSWTRSWAIRNTPGFNASLAVHERVSANYEGRSNPSSSPSPFWSLIWSSLRPRQPKPTGCAASFGINTNRSPHRSPVPHQPRDIAWLGPINGEKKSRGVRVRISMANILSTENRSMRENRPVSPRSTPEERRDAPGGGVLNEVYQIGMFGIEAGIGNATSFMSHLPSASCLCVSWSGLGEPPKKHRGNRILRVLLWSFRVPFGVITFDPYECSRERDLLSRPDFAVAVSHVLFLPFSCTVVSAKCADRVHLDLPSKVLIGLAHT